MKAYGLKFLGIMGLTMLFIFSVIFKIVQLSNQYYFMQIEDIMNFRNLLNNMYFVVISMATVGYGELQPSTNIAKFMMIIIILFGVWLISLIVASLNILIFLTEDETKVNLIK